MVSSAWNITLLLGFILLLSVVASIPSIHYDFVTDENGLRHYILLPEISSLNYNPYGSLTNVQFTEYDNMWDLSDASLVDWMGMINILQSSLLFLVLASIEIISIIAMRHFWSNIKPQFRKNYNSCFYTKMKNILNQRDQEKIKCNFLFNKERNKNFTAFFILLLLTSSSTLISLKFLIIQYASDTYVNVLPNTSITVAAQSRLTHHQLL